MNQPKATGHQGVEPAEISDDPSVVMAPAVEAESPAVIHSAETMPTFSATSQPVLAHERAAAEERRRREIREPQQLGPIQFGLNQEPVNSVWLSLLGGWVLIAIYMLIGLPVIASIFTGFEQMVLRLVGIGQQNRLVFGLLFP